MLIADAKKGLCPSLKSPVYFFVFIRNQPENNLGCLFLHSQNVLYNLINPCWYKHPPVQWWPVIIKLRSLFWVRSHYGCWDRIEVPVFCAWMEISRSSYTNKLVWKMFTVGGWSKFRGIHTGVLEACTYLFVLQKNEPLHCKGFIILQRSGGGQTRAAWKRWHCLVSCG